MLPTGRYPLAVIFISLPAEAVDVNVHPTKSEVRFRKGNEAFGAVQRAVRQTLIADSPIPQTTHFTSFTPQGWRGSLDQSSFSRRDEPPPQGHLELDWSSPAERDVTSSDSQSDLGGEGLPIMRVVGQVGAAYIITEGPQGLFLIDQHAAHERILYEQFMVAWEEADGREGMAAQGLVDGRVVQLSPSQATLLGDQLPLLERLGFRVEPFGPNSFMVRSVPAMLTKVDPAKALMEVVEDLEWGEAPMQKTIESRIILRVCKSAAVKAGQTLD